MAPRDSIFSAPQRSLRTIARSSSGSLENRDKYASARVSPKISCIAISKTQTRQTSVDLRDQNLLDARQQNSGRRGAVFNMLDDSFSPRKPDGD